MHTSPVDLKTVWSRKASQLMSLEGEINKKTSQSIFLSPTALRVWESIANFKELCQGTFKS